MTSHTWRVFLKISEPIFGAYRHSPRRQAPKEKNDTTFSDMDQPTNLQRTINHKTMTSAGLYHNILQCILFL